MATEDPRRDLGRRGEKLAARELRRRGYRIVARNWRGHLGEIDLIAKHREDLVIVEVKSRVGEAFGGPELAVGAVKQRKLSRLLDEYLAGVRGALPNCRFDIVALVTDERFRVVECEVFEDAFDYVS